jgi:hypothetical protein
MGFDETRVRDHELRDLFNEVHHVLLPDEARSEDAEALYVVGLMAHLSPYLLGDNDEWEARSARYRMRYREILPDGIDPATFEGQGAYGDYFRGQVTVKGGY